MARSHDPHPCPAADTRGNQQKQHPSRNSSPHLWLKSSMECSGSSGLKVIPESGCTSPCPPHAPLPEGTWGNSTPSWQAARRRCWTSSRRNPLEESAQTRMSSRLWNLNPTTLCSEDLDPITLFAEKLECLFHRIAKSRGGREGWWVKHPIDSSASRACLAFPPRKILKDWPNPMWARFFLPPPGRCERAQCNWLRSGPCWEIAHKTERYFGMGSPFTVGNYPQTQSNPDQALFVLDS